ncbi:MAG: hypothetical protein LBQ71_11400 [Hungatella sp.]|jgi:hypothetical protein|nr:hypothetical protein [Hungatella sp.]
MQRLIVVVKISVKLFLLLSVMTLFFCIMPIAVNAKTVDVNLEVCQEGGRTDKEAFISTNKDNILGVSGGVIFNTPDPPDTTIRLATSNGVAWIRNYNGNNIWPRTAKADYHITFYDNDWNNVWQESKTIENGEKQRFFIGANVRYIQVWSTWDYNKYALNYIGSIIVAPEVVWDGVVN